ncbi:MAG: hypothetical protein Q8P22_10140 [Chloroflexota bacterium]|nr:hypothetical protein [Chloroflexota bacterium]
MADLEVLNPVAQLASELGRSVKAARRPRSIQGQRVGLYWNRKPGGNFALQRVRERLLERYPHMEVHFYSARRPIPEEVVAEIRARCDVVVGATGD